MERLSISVLCAGIFLGASSAAYGQSPAAQPTLEAAHAIQLFEEAGFPLEEGRPVNRCGKPSNPRIAFIDLNADGRAEALERLRTETTGADGAAAPVARFVKVKEFGLTRWPYWWVFAASAAMRSQ